MILASNYIMLSGTYEIQLKIDAVAAYCSVILRLEGVLNK
jgi:hypothetical protein